MAPIVSSNSNIIVKTAEPIACWCQNERQKNAESDHLQSLPRTHKFVRFGEDFEVARQSVSKWIIEHIKDLPKLKDTLLPAEPGDVLEYDEAWSFVLKKTNKRWLWTVMCRRTRQIIAFAIGDRSETTCRHLWNKVPREYRSCISYSDFWDAYQNVLPQETHHAVGKESGQTSHMERWYCTLRQHQARYVRKTLSFSKCDAFHHMVTKWFIVDHHLATKQLASLTP